jgi:hypothetical protein
MTQISMSRISMTQISARIARALAALSLLAMLLAVCGSSAYAATRYYVVANNDSSSNSVSIYEVSGTSLVSVSTVPTGGLGIGGGYFAAKTQSIAQDGSNTCVFAGDAGSPDISAMKIIATSPFLKVVSNYVSPDGDAATDYGLGILVAGGYLYANYTGNTLLGGTTSPAIGVWKIGAGCTLTFASHLVTSGLNGGAIDGMAVTPSGKYLVVGYGDGSIGSYAIGGGSISLIGQEIIAGNTVGAGAYAGSAAVSSNGLWAIFGDFSPSNTTQLDVAGIGSNGVLAATTTYGGTGSLGNGVDTNGIQLSPNNNFIYVVDSYSGQETTVAFDSTTGVISYPHACLTSLNGYNTDWAYASQPAAVINTGSGGGLYISEAFLNGDSYIALLQVNATTGCATEVKNSPFLDSNTPGLESITAFSH